MTIGAILRTELHIARAVMLLSRFRSEFNAMLYLKYESHVLQISASPDPNGAYEMI